MLGKQKFNGMMDIGQAAVGLSGSMNQVKKEVLSSRVKYRGPELHHELLVET